MARKLSVSVPDELWDRAQTQHPDLNPSHLVQAALETFTRPADTAGYSLARPADADLGFEAARANLAARARAEFEDGYRAGVELVPVIGWWYLQNLAEKNFDVLGWSRALADSSVEAELGYIPQDWAAETEVIRGLIKALGGHISPWGDNEPRRTAPFLRGFAQAFRDLWAQVNDGEAAVAAEEEAALGQ